MVPYVNLDKGVEIYRAGLWLVMTTRLGMRVMWDGGTRVQITVRPTLKNQLTGLCGAYTGRSAIVSNYLVIEKTTSRKTVKAAFVRCGILCKICIVQKSTHHSLKYYSPYIWKLKKMILRIYFLRKYGIFTFENAILDLRTI